MADSEVVTDREYETKGLLLSMQHIHKSFGEVNVLKGVNFHIGSNEIVGLVGDNGAGKSTLIKLITGVHRPDSGDIYYKKEKITIHSVKRSRELGIETVYQERALGDQQTLWRNMFAGRELTPGFPACKRAEVADPEDAAGAHRFYLEGDYDGFGRDVAFRGREAGSGDRPGSVLSR
jgi:ABC-type sugar transport system ATPase subunit